MEKAREFQKNINFCFIDCANAFDCVDHNKLWKIFKEMGILDHLTCLLRNLYDDVITNLEPNILESEVKWALESITTNKASGGEGMPVELFQSLKDDAVKVLHSICQQI